MAAVRASFVAGVAEVEGENRGVIVGVAFRAAPYAEKETARTEPAKSESRKERRGAKEIDDQPILDGQLPKMLAHPPGVPSIFCPTGH